MLPLFLNAPFTQKVLAFFLKLLYNLFVRYSKGSSRHIGAFRRVRTIGDFPVREELKWQDFCYNIGIVVTKVFFFTCITARKNRLLYYHT